MNRTGLAQGVIDALIEPAFLLTGTGALLGANRAARAMLGTQSASGDLADRLAMPPDEYARFLARCRQTTTPMPGALVFRTGEGERRVRVHCGRLSGQQGEAILLLRCADPRGDRFSVLAQRVRQLDAELRQRVREKAVLSEALDENRNLMRELQHRVKNNIQMMISLLTMSAASSRSAEAKSVMAGVKERFHALAATQDLIYESQSASVISAGELIERLARVLGESADGTVEVRTEIGDIWLPQENAHCLALIVNELVTNSLKHGVNDGTGKVLVALERDGGHLRLIVQDDGPGYPAPDALPRSSGLTLIRGLCRQLGAGLELGNAGGARSVVSIAADGLPGAGTPERHQGRPAEMQSTFRPNPV